MIIGCDAGTLNVLKIKGTHNAMKSGIIAAEVFFESSKNNFNESELSQYSEAFRNSFIFRELYKSRNIRPGFNYGLFPGLLNSFVDQKIFRGKAHWTLKHKEKENEAIKNIY